GPVASLPAESATLVTGDPGALLQLAAQGILRDQPTVLAGDDPGVNSTPHSVAVTDTARRQDHAFGLLQHNTSYTYTAAGTNPADDPHGNAGEPPRQLLPAAESAPQTVAEISGAADVTASSYGSWFGEMPEFDPVNAFDGDQD